MSDSRDNFAVHAIIGVLGLIAVGGFATICVLAVQRHDIPALLATLVLGVITTLAPSPLHALKSADPQAVTVTNTPADPVPTTESPLATAVVDGMQQTAERVQADPHPDAPESSDL